MMQRAKFAGSEKKNTRRRTGCFRFRLATKVNCGSASPRAL